jgi:hypothetical protein
MCFNFVNNRMVPILLCYIVLSFVHMLIMIKSHVLTYSVIFIGKHIFVRKECAYVILPRAFEKITNCGHFDIIFIVFYLLSNLDQVSSV